MKIIPNANLPEVPQVNGLRYLRSGTQYTWNGPSTEVVSPVNNQVIGQLASLDEATALLALEGAKKAWDNGRGQWPMMHPQKRIEAMETFAARMRAKTKQLATMLCYEIAKPYKDSEKEITRTVEYIEQTLVAYKTLEANANIIQKADGFMAQIRRAPLGVCMVMGPYNYPINETFCLLIPSLLMGNTTVLKGARFGALTLNMLLEDFAACFPPGVVNTINGSGPTVVTPIMKEGSVNVLAFIGSSGAARAIRGAHPKQNRLRAVLGLEAKNVAIIEKDLTDAQLDKAVDECLLGSLSYNGQRCTAIKLVAVHASQHAEFVKRFSAKVENLVAGNPFDPAVQITPMPHISEVNRLQDLLTKAIAQGATKAYEAPTYADNPNLLLPTVLTKVTLSSDIARLEQFGPIVPIVSWSEQHELLDYLSNSNVGQQLAVFTYNAQTAAFWIDNTAQLQCRLNLNSQCQRGPDVFPFTGRKDSAEGTLSITDALRCFSIRNMVALKLNTENTQLATEILDQQLSNVFSTRVIL